MPRRSILSAVERESLLAFPDSNDEMIRHYTLSEADLSLIRQRRGNLTSACNSYLRGAALTPRNRRSSRSTTMT